MIVADTNVWSEAVRRAPDPTAMAWVLEHRDELAMTTVTVGELLVGVELMPAGRRRTALAAHVDALIAGAAHRTFGYDEAAAREFAAIEARRRSIGREVTAPEDAMIAAIAASRGWPVATRNVPDFEGMGVVVIDPWAARTVQ